MNASAPGKLFLVGEYAVLEGGPALLVPVKQRAKVTIEASNSSQVISHTTTVEKHSPEEALQRYPLLQATMAELGCLEQLQNAQLSLDTSAFFNRGVKLGLGSSAALTTALVKLFHPDATTKERLAKAFRCHLAFQNGIGSGADIALSAMDETIVFKRGESPIPVVLPGDLHLLAIWSGEPASTTGYVAAVNRWRQNNPDAYQSLINDLRNTATGCIDALEKKDSQRVLARIEQYDRHLERLSSVSGVNFYNQAHLEMRKKVESAHCAYKPSGAGGGDYGIAYSTDRQELLTLADKLEREHSDTFVL
jgi:phosphomevalonate kinase